MPIIISVHFFLPGVSHYFIIDKRLIEMKTLVAPGNIDLHFCYTSEFCASALENILSTSEHQHANLFLLEENQNQFIISRAILKLLLASYTGQPVQSIQIKNDFNGKPYMVDKSDILFNISHSGNALLLGFTMGAEIGVDIERTNRTINHSKIIPILFSESEHEAFNHLKDSDKRVRILKSWTSKEAFFKAKGFGLKFPMIQLELSFLAQNVVQIINTDWDSMEKEHWSLKSFKLENQYHCAVAVNERIAQINLHKVKDTDSLLKRSILSHQL